MLSLLAHGGQPLAPHDAWTAWNLDPLVLGGLAAVGLVHLRGRTRPSTPTGRRRAHAFTAAWWALVLALVSPLEAMSSALASAHMVQHVLLVLVAAPLLALAAPTATLLRGLPVGVARAVAPLRRGPLGMLGRATTRPVVAWLLHVATLWTWHAAGPYDAAVASPVLHVVEHASFLLTGVLLWTALIGPHRSRAEGTGVVMVFALAIQSVLLSALLTFAGEPWYAAYLETTAAWGLTPLDDQHLAGVIMWFPAGAVHVGAGLALLVAWIRSTESAGPSLDGTVEPRGRAPSPMARR